MKKYYLIINGIKEGPFSLNELLKLDINKNTLVWYNGINDWVEIQYVTELSDIFDQLAPPIPETHKNSAQNIKIESPIDIKILDKNKLSEEEVMKRNRRLVKRILKEIGILLLYFVISSLIAVATYYIFYNLNKPELVSDENQAKFNEKYYERKEKNPYSVPLGDLYFDYLGYYKFDNKLVIIEQFFNINENRYYILTDKSYTISWYVFFSLLSVLVFIRYLIAFLRWLNSGNFKDANYEDSDFKHILKFLFY